MESFKVYDDSDTCRNFNTQAQAYRYYADRSDKGLFALYVNQVGTQFLVRASWINEVVVVNETGFESLLKSL